MSDNDAEHIQHLISMPRHASLKVDIATAARLAGMGPLEAQGYQWRVKVRDVGYGRTVVRLEEMA